MILSAVISAGVYKLCGQNLTASLMIVVFEAAVRMQ